MQSKNFCHLNCIRQKTAPVSRCGLTIALYRLILILLELPSLGSFLNGNGNSDCHTNHGVVSCSDQTHHLHMSRYGRRTCKLSVRMHTAQCICHTVGSGACRHVVRMKGTSCTAAGCYREIFLSCFHALFLICTCHRMLETGGVGGVSGDG